jgi:glycosyltransferase involved in cell wall biosynthesis
MFEKEELVSIIIPAFNAELFISEAIESVLKQNYKNIEIIIVNDGSTDHTRTIIERYAANDARIKLFSQNNSGQGAARNAGIINSKGDYVAFLDADDVWLVTKIEKQINYFRKHEDVGMVHTYRKIAGEKGIIDYQNWQKSKIKNLNGNIYKKILAGNWICASSVMIKKEVLQKLGYFDESRKISGNEDWDMWIRTAKEYNVGYIDEPLTMYRDHRNGVSKNIENHMNSAYEVVSKSYKTYSEKDKTTLYNKVLSFLHFHTGAFYLYRSRDGKKARKEFKKAITLNVFDFIVYKYFIRTFFAVH